MWQGNDRRDSGARDFGAERGFAPVHEGEELEVTIQAVGAKGDGIAKKDGFVIFVPKTKAGEKVRIKVTKVLSKVGFGEVVGGSKAAPAEKPKEAAPEEEYFEGHEDSEDFGEQ